MYEVIATIQPCHKYTCTVVDKETCQQVENVSFYAEDGAIMYELLKKYNVSQLYIYGKKEYADEYIRDLEEKHLNGDYYLHRNLQITYL